MRMPFGKYKGVEIDDIEEGYLLWVLDNCDRINPFLRRAIEDSLGLKPDAPPTAGAPPTLEPLVRQWYREMTLKYHPDRGGSNEAMQAVNDGHDLLRRLSKGSGS